MAETLPITGAAEQPPAPDNTQKPARSAREWLDDIKRAEHDLAGWATRSKKIEDIWLEQRETADKFKRQYALLWANVSVLQPAVYAKTPSPVVTRRFSDKDPVARNVSEVMERALVTIFDQGDVDSCLRSARDNFLVVGQGTAWVRYVPTFEAGQFEVEDGTEPFEELADETLAFDFVHWSDFIRPKARRWEDLPWVGRRVYLGDDVGEMRFGKDKWAKVKSAAAAKTGDYAKSAPRDKPCIYEIWSKSDRMVLWLAQGFGEDFLDVKPPLYDLKEFFPCPRPAFGTLPTDALEPVADYVYYQDQAEEINKLTAKIGQLEDALKLVGFYPAGAEGGISSAIETALSADTSNKMVPVPGWSQFVQGGGVKAMIEWLPLDQVLGTLKGCIELRKQLIDDVYQITGISDIIRGQSVASETATAQNIKTQWGGVRIRDRQNELARFCRDLTRIAAEIIAEKFQPDTIFRLCGLQFPTMQQKQMLQMQIQQMQQQQAMVAQQTGQQPKPMQIPDQVKQLLQSPTREDIINLMRDDRMRSYRVDIETDSTIAVNEQEEKQSRQEFVTVLGGMLQQALPVAQAVPELVPVIGEALLFLTRAYRTGRQMEDTIENAVEAISQKAQTSQTMPPPPDPRMEKVKADATLGQQKLQLQAQESAAKIQTDRMQVAAKAQLDRQALAHDQQLEWARLLQRAGVPSNIGYYPQ